MRNMCHLAAFTGGLLISMFGLSASVLANEVKTYTYDALGRLVVVQNSGTANSGQVRTYCYDAAGNRVKFVSNSSGPPASCP